jgi:hypothetical protein
VCYADKLPLPCSYFAKGACARGRSCRFAHGDRELQGAIGERGNVRHRAVKTQLCSFFLRGRCLSGARCFFAHGEAELRSSAETLNGSNATLSSDELKGRAQEPDEQDSLLGQDPYESMTSARVHRWDEELGRWVVETLEIEDLPLPPCHSSSSSEQAEQRKPVEPKALDLAAVLPPPACSKGRREGQRIQLLLESRTPLRRSAASFVPWSH